MSANFEPVISENVARAIEALQRVRSLRESILAKGIDGIYDHFEDVDGDWLENWTDEDIVEIDKAASNTVVQSADQH
ncbi:hypothetical protein NIES4071_54310 [Calothrix sp. NIES-4071]|nr:hypothetical protein NIES4071_54310 [Calothrix sp. NIES-4071]BAZ59739.1 hypothetical protein NIES4105_54260 [Calothrix sp. NIES-4105]